MTLPIAVCLKLRAMYVLVPVAGLLTKKFIDLIKQADDGVLDLNKAADTLNVSAIHFRGVAVGCEGSGA